ncbi:MAG: sialate O-acetylesterase, partial [Methylacidiphilales bacterium]|nr:sialate O-acetylesterase [Candidatus Methylacidiphilales bacterium]
AKKKWDEQYGAANAAALNTWKSEAATLATEGKPAPPMPKPEPPAPVPPLSPDGWAKSPTGLFNAMVAPLIPYAIKGVIWYQGEANEDAPAQYATLFSRMITDWREKWGQGDFPFLFVQLANFKKRSDVPTDSAWARVRESQLKTLKLPQTGMAVIIDLGVENNIHPIDKYDVGLRLGKAARHVAYGQDLVYSGPIFQSMTVEQNKVRIKFSQIGGGLAIGTPPWTPPGAVPPSTTELKGFSIAGADQKWVWAKAQIDGDSVQVWNEEVTDPVAVRYAWADNPECNLYDKEGLPASPFRTDDWPYQVQAH